MIITIMLFANAQSLYFINFMTNTLKFHLLQIFLLLFIILYVASFTLLERFKRRGVEDYYSTDKDEITVYRISTWLCTFALSISIGAVLLLPISIVSNEVLLLYPNSYYVKWLNISLIQGNNNREQF